MSFSTTLSLQHSIHNNRNCSTASDEQPLQFVEIRLRRSSKLMSPYSNQIIQETHPTLISDALFHYPLRELEDPPFLSHYFILRFLSPFDLPPAASDAIFEKIDSFTLGLAGGNLNLNFHIIATVDLVYTFWLDELEPEEVVPQDSPAAMKGAPAWVIESVMNEKYDGNGREEMGDECMICCEELQLDGETEKELSRIRCGHVYHKSCILKWLSINNSCPLCRKELEE